MERALRLIGASDAIRERAGGGLSALDILRLENPQISALRTLPAEEVERLTAEGRNMSLEQALAYAREGLPAPAS
jgi:hypothetical protein